MGLLSALGIGGGSESSGSTDKNPWAGAIPWIQNNMVAGQNLQNQYAAQPFNDLQKQQYSNLFGDINRYRDTIAPGLMDFAGGLMGRQYQRQRGGAPGSGAGYGGAVRPGGLLQSGASNPFARVASALNGGQTPMNLLAGTPQAPQITQQAIGQSDIDQLKALIEELRAKLNPQSYGSNGNERDHSYGYGTSNDSGRGYGGDNGGYGMQGGYSRDN